MIIVIILPGREVNLLSAARAGACLVGAVVLPQFPQPRQVGGGSEINIILIFKLRCWNISKNFFLCFDAMLKSDDLITSKEIRRVLPNVSKMAHLERSEKSTKYNIWCEDKKHKSILVPGIYFWSSTLNIITWWEWWRGPRARYCTASPRPGDPSWLGSCPPLGEYK